MVNEKKEYIKAIVGLKGIGAFIIAFIWHYQHFGPETGRPLFLVFELSYSLGWSMVDLFFILSGFGLMLGYEDRIYKNAITFKTFILHRFKKVYPLFLLSAVLIIFFEWIYQHRTMGTFVYNNFDIYHIILNLLMLQDGVLGTEYSLNAPAWCISVFFVDYCLFYFILYKAKERTHILYCFCVTAILGAALVASGLNFPILNDQIGRGISGFSIGGDYLLCI